jgi:hypothetical protein
VVDMAHASVGRVWTLPKAWVYAELQRGTT